MPRFQTSGHTLSPQDQIINVLESLFFMKKLGHFRPFYGVTEPTPLADNNLFGGLRLRIIQCYRYSVVPFANAKFYISQPIPMLWKLVEFVNKGFSWDKPLACQSQLKCQIAWIWMGPRVTLYLTLSWFYFSSAADVPVAGIGSRGLVRSRGLILLIPDLQAVLFCGSIQPRLQTFMSA